MAKVIILGSSNSIPDEHHENTHMVVVGRERTVLIDCASNPIIRLRQAGLEFSQLTDLVLTHFHPDHVSGVALLLMDMWLLGRTEALNIYGLHHTLDRMEDLMGFYDWQNWPNFFPVAFHRLPVRNMVEILDTPEIRVTASPVKHLIPTIGLRVDFPEVGCSLAYSCDTEPCPEVVELAGGVDVLIHEATGVSVGHSSAAQAGEVARQAQAKALYLIHYPANSDRDSLLEAASQTFGGPVSLAEDFQVLEF